jgi:hypothetical protein
LETIGGQAVACHFWRQIPAQAVLPAAAAATPARQRLARLQSAFVAAAPAVLSS